MSSHTASKYLTQEAAVKYTTQKYNQYNLTRKPS